MIELSLLFALIIKNNNLQKLKITSSPQEMLTQISRKFSKLKTLLEKEIIPQKKDELLELRKKHADKVVGHIKVDQLIMGMREMPAMFYDGSALHPKTGITFRGHTISEVEKHGIKAPNGHEPLPESILYLCLTGRFANKEELQQLSAMLKNQSKIQEDVKKFILSLPRETHAMTMLSLSLLYLQRNSKFAKQYEIGMIKSQYWSYYFDDAISLLGKLPELAAIIYRHKYRNSQLIKSDQSLDWAANYGHMMGYNTHEFYQCLRGYLTIHSDHEGGNVSAHTCHLVGSALADPYLSYSAALNGLAGPLHGLANQQCLKWLLQLKRYHEGRLPNKAIIEEFVKKTLQSGRVIPGYGHAVLRHTDPRFLHQVKFAKRHIHNDEIVDLVKLCYETIPDVLGKVGKIKNPYPNVDAHSGALLQHFGLVEYQYYTVVFAVSRAIGCLSNGVWSRAFGLPIERPNSVDMAWIKKHGQIGL